MGFESQALDAVAEVEEHSEWEVSPDIPVDEELEASPDIPVDESDGFHVESLRSAEDVESLLNVESGKTTAVIGLAESTITSAIKATGDPTMFAEELNEIKELTTELQSLTSAEGPWDINATLEDDAISNLYQEPVITDGVGVYETNSGITDQAQVTEGLGTLPAYETIETIQNVASLSEKPLTIMGTEFSNLNESERFTVERAGSISYYSSEKAQNPEELHALVENIKQLSNKEFPDDAKFEASLAVIMADMEHRFADMPVILEDGAVDLVTGKKSSIEIIDDAKYVPKVEKPTKEQLDEANRELMSTTRGRMMDMLAYLQDYEAVATGKLEHYQQNMPESRMRELKRKSWFSDLEHADNNGVVKSSVPQSSSGRAMAQKLSPSEVQTPEIISGLTLTWESAADYYESIGNKAQAEFIRETGKFQLIELPNGDRVIGETHLRLLNNAEYQEKFDNLLRRLKPRSLVLVEHTSDYEKNGWTQLSAEERFMQQAEKFGQDPSKDVELEVMDNSIEEPFDAWKEAKMDELISEEDYSFLQGMKDASEKIVQPNGIDDLVSQIESDPNMSESSRTARLLGITRFIERLAKGGQEATQYIQQLMHAKATLLELDSMCREVHYQNVIAQKKLENPDRNVLVVVGNSHSRGMEQTLQDFTYRTPRNTNSAQSLKYFIDSQKTVKV